MLSYQHAYHAGNFADVVKHITLCLICDYLTKKDKPLFYIETHSGRGKYDLRLPISQKTAEFKDGVGLIWQNKSKIPEVFSPWLRVIEKYNHHELTYYPGSPLFALECLRQQDRFQFCELHPGEFEILKQLNKQQRSVLFAFQDGMQALNATLPPKEKRGLIFIDPSYELKQEYQTIPKIIQQVYKKFPTGVYCLWYPILSNDAYLKLNKGMQKIDCLDKLHIEYFLGNDKKVGMHGCGIWILNPPYILKTQIDEVVSTLKQFF